MKPKQLDLLDGLAFPLKDTQSFRNELELMMFPFFTPGRRPVHLPQEFRWTTASGEESYIRNSPGEDGLPTQFDLDILIYTITLIVAAMNRNEPVSPRVRFHIHDCLIAINRGTGGREYSLFHQSLRRLKGTTVFTNVKAGDAVEDGGFGWIQSFRLSKRTLTSGREMMAACEITICDWLFNAVAVDKRILALPPEYFSIESGLERKIYLLVRAHLGTQTTWPIGLDKLRQRVGSTSPAKRFNFEIRQMVERDPFPEWKLFLSADGRIPTARNPLTVVEPTRRGRPIYLIAQRRHALLPRQ